MAEEKTIIADAANLTIFKVQNRKKACLIQYNGAKIGRRYSLNEPIMIIGRSPEVNLAITEASVSRQHARVYLTETSVDIEDLGSSNGTFINDQRIQAKSTLKDGDMLRLGTIMLKFFAFDNVESIMADKIYRMATIDAGTQIFNKQYLIDSLESEFKFSKTYQKPLSIIYYDLDHFKKVNDTYGHNFGDYILKESANVVKAMIRKDDVLGRFGGEEFVVILPNTEQRIAADLAERIRGQIANHVFLFSPGSGQPQIKHQQTISIGVSQISAEIHTYEQFLESADKKLYSSKQSGRNKVTV